MALKWLVAVVTSGSADAFAETEFQTGLSNVTRQALRIRRIEWWLSPLPGVDCNIQAAIRRNTSASFLTAIGNPMISMIQRCVEFTTSGGMIQTQAGPGNVMTYDKDEELLIVEESLFLTIDSNATSAACSAIARIGYEVRNITENERLSIQAATAS